MGALPFEEIPEGRVELVEAVEQRLSLPLQLGGQFHHVEGGDRGVLVAAIRSRKITERFLGPEDELVRPPGVHRLSDVFEADEKIVDDGHVVPPADRPEQGRRHQGRDDKMLRRQCAFAPRLRST